VEPFDLFRTCSPARLVFCGHSARRLWWRLCAESPNRWLLPRCSWLPDKISLCVKSMSIYILQISSKM